MKINFDETHKKFLSYPLKKLIFLWLLLSTLLSPDSLLTCLFPDDGGDQAPNPSSLYQLAKVG